MIGYFPCYEPPQREASGIAVALAGVAIRVRTASSKELLAKLVGLLTRTGFSH
jgi:hypothetical protein